MDGQIMVVPLVVRDQAKALEFYTMQVGFEKKTDVAPPGGTRWVTVGPSGQALEFSLWQLGSPTDPSQWSFATEWAPGRSPPILIRVSDCRRTYEEMSGRGVRFVQPPLDHPWGVSATFSDPDNNLFSLQQPPSRPPGR